MKNQQRQGLTYCWTLVLLLLVLFHEMVVGQPQVYFKASLPAKSLPRIGRRSDSSSDLFPVNNEGWNDGWNLNNNYGRPESLLLWKKIMGDSMFQDETPQLSLSPNLFKFKGDK
ncbi:unnamed protein product [Allacma fusca]|uniref:Uncharacterized protein n=1 Tax=Allacma fusca TaxID=39272 RepID=A0A8J2LA90_9HEXA|nr:unnamed protein product [Allacma fusca]